MRPADATLLELQVLFALDARDRQALAERLAQRLGRDFEASSTLAGDAGLPCLLHRETQLLFAVVPGGSFEMGFTEADRAALTAAFPLRDWVEEFVRDALRSSLPLRRVRVRPFLVSLRPLREEEVVKVSKGAQRFDTFARADAIHFVESTSCRLPSEAELEWLAREGGVHAFTYDGSARFASEREYPNQGSWGIERLTRGEWAADDWHEGYEGAPEDSSPWLRGDPTGVHRGSLPFGVDADEREIVLGLACNRGHVRPGSESSRATRFMVRLAHDLPLE